MQNNGVITVRNIYFIVCYQVSLLYIINPVKQIVVKPIE
jgi:hypothetical protein